jgi:SAM-dependent methyltransferase
MIPTGDARGTFSRIYDEDAWNGGSGAGSAEDATTFYREVIENLCRARDVRSVLDIGCGDWQLGSLVDWSQVRYVGVDVVPSVIEANRQRYARPGISFEVADARQGELPDADLLLAKDVLQHWPNGDVATFLDAHLRRYRYVLLTNDIASVQWTGPMNHDVPLGGWRPVDLEVEPFGRSANWRGEYDVRGEWTKRMVLYASGARATRWRPGSALRRLP